MTATYGQLFAVKVHTVDVRNREGARGALKYSFARFPLGEKIYSGGRINRLHRTACSTANGGY